MEEKGGIVQTQMGNNNEHEIDALFYRASVRLNVGPI